MIVTGEAEMIAAQEDGRAAVLAVPRCGHCGLTVMSCPDTRWAEYHGVYPLWMPKTLVDAAGQDGWTPALKLEARRLADAQANRLCKQGLLR